MRSPQIEVSSTSPLHLQILCMHFLTNPNLASELPCFQDLPTWPMHAENVALSAENRQQNPKSMVHVYMYIYLSCLIHYMVHTSMVSPANDSHELHQLVGGYPFRTQSDHTKLDPMIPSMAFPKCNENVFLLIYEYMIISKVVMLKLQCIYSIHYI